MLRLRHSGLPRSRERVEAKKKTKCPRPAGHLVTPTLQSDSDPWRDDLQLVRSVLAGDRSAFERFVQRMNCVPVILSHCNAQRRGILSQEDLADLGQDVLTTVWKRLPDYLGQGALESWVYPFCTQMFLNSARTRRRRPPALDLESAAEFPARDERVSDLLATSELVHRHLARLEAIQSTVIRARHFEGLSFEEIAQRLGVPLTTAKTHYQRGLDVLRRYLAPHIGNDFA